MCFVLQVRITDQSPYSNKLQEFLRNTVVVILYTVPKLSQVMGCRGIWICDVFACVSSNIFINFCYPEGMFPYDLLRRCNVPEKYIVIIFSQVTKGYKDRKSIRSNLIIFLYIITVGNTY